MDGWLPQESPDQIIPDQIISLTVFNLRVCVDCHEPMT